MIMNITKDSFIATLTAAQHYSNVSDELYKMGLTSDITVLDEAVITIVDLLDEITNKSEWVSYWAFEMNWGKEICDDSVKDKDGNNIPLKTMEDLWNMLDKE